MKKAWHAIYVSSRQEKKVYEALKKKGIESYLPLVKTLRNWSDRKKVVEFPLLAGYVFVHISSPEHIHVLQTRGVVNFVMNAGKVGVVYEKEIESLKQLVSLGFHLDVFPATFETGDRVRITSGVLKNLEGRVIEESNQEYFNVFLEGIGYNIRVRLPAGVLKKTVD